MSIRNLRGAPSLGADSSNLDNIIHDLPRTGSGHSHHGHSSLTSSFVHGDRDGLRRSGHHGHYGHHYRLHGGHGNGSGNSHKFLPSHHQNMAGEVIGSSLNSSLAHSHFFTNNTNGSNSHATGNVFSSLRRPRARTVSHDYMFHHSYSGDMDASSTSVPSLGGGGMHPPLPPPSPSPTSSGRFRKFRAATWDSAGVGLGKLNLSPLTRLSSDRSGFSGNDSVTDDGANNNAAGVGSGGNADSTKNSINICNQGVISEHDVYFEESSYDSELSTKIEENDDNDRNDEGNDGRHDQFAGRIDLPPRLPMSAVEYKAGMGESKQSSLISGVEDDEDMEDENTQFQSAIRAQIRAHQSSNKSKTNDDNRAHNYNYSNNKFSAASEHSENTTNTNNSSKREVKFSNKITEYSITDASNLESQSIVKTFPSEEQEQDDGLSDSNITHPDPERRHAIHGDPLTSSKILAIESSALSLEKGLARERSQRYSQYDASSNDHHDFFTKLNPFRNLSWSVVGSYIVRTAPCFWCMRKLSISATDREILLRLNGLCSFFCVVQIALGLFLFSTSVMGVVQERDDAVEDAAFAADANGAEGKQLNVGEEEDIVNVILISPDLWNLKLFVYMLSIVNVVLLIASVLSQRVIREVNLVGSVRFMWSLFWLLPIQIFLMIGLFDYYRVMEVWIKHFWGDASMAYLRGLFCEEGTENDQCMVPIMGGEEYKNEKAWCLAKYNSTRCEYIRNEAQYECTVASYIFFTSNGVWALILVFLIWVTLSVLQAIISVPIVQRSKESNIPLWLTLPIVGCFGLGYILLYAPRSMTVKQSSQDLYWIGLCYFVSGGAFALAAVVGCFLKFYSVLNRREKKFKQGIVVFFNVTIILTIFAVATIFTTSLIYALNIVDISLDSYQSIACMLDFGGSCTGCDSGKVHKMCPEWSEDDVKTVLKTIMKQSATVAAIFLVYAFITLRYGFLLFRHVSSYHIEYV